MNERIARFFHGTTVVRAQRIADAAAFSPQRTFLALGESNRDLAVIFAQRTVSKHPAEGGPALVIITMEESSFESMRKRGLMRMIGFDPEDKPELRNRFQWVVEPGGVLQFNRDADEWIWIRA
jgi:hypothetical protein